MLINELFKIARVNFLLFPLIRKTWISKILNFKKTWTWIKIFINTRILKIFNQILLPVTLNSIYLRKENIVTIFKIFFLRKKY